MLTERAAALLNGLEHQAQAGIDELVRLRRRLAALEAENRQLRDALAQSEEALTQAAVPRSAAERGYPLPRHDASSSEYLVEKPADTYPAPRSDEPVSSSQPAVEAPSPQALLNEWYRRYTHTFFKGHTRPLQVGIHEELIRREPWPDKLVRRALACYVHLPRYLKAVRSGAERVDLDGRAAGNVTDGEAEHARKQLEALQARRREQHRREQGADEVRQNARLDRKLGALLAKHGQR